MLVGLAPLIIVIAVISERMFPWKPGPHHTPQPGMPMLWMILMPTWAMNTKKKIMKLKELSLLWGQRQEQNIWKASRCCGVTPKGSYNASRPASPGLPEGLVDGPEPAHVRAGGEHEEPDDGQSEVGHAAAAEHPHEAANQIHHQRGGVNWKHKHLTDHLSEPRGKTGFGRIILLTVLL